MEAEIQRKKEHQSFATNFEKARGFVRTNWKSKNFKPEDNPCEEDSSTDDSEVERRQQAEDRDIMSDDDDRDGRRRASNKRGGSQSSANELIDIS